MGRKAEPVVVITNSDLIDNGGQYQLLDRYALKVIGDETLEVGGGTPSVVYPVTSSQIASGEFSILGGEPIRVARVSGRGQGSSKYATPVYNTLGSWPEPTYADNVLALNPVAYYPLNEISGTTADNAEGTVSLDGTYTGLTLADLDGPMTGESSPLGDGINDYLTLPAAAFDGIWNGDTFTVSLWVDATAHTSGVRLFNLTTSTADNVEILLRTSPTGSIFNCTAGGALDSAQVDGADPEWPGDGLASWTNLIVTRDNGSNTLSIYTNNGGPQTNTGSTGVWGGTVNSVTLYAANSTPDNPFNGHLAHVAFFDRVVTSGERATLATIV